MINFVTNDSIISIHTNNEIKVESLTGDIFMKINFGIPHGSVL